MISVHVTEAVQSPIPLEEVERVVQETLVYAAAPVESDLTIVLTGDRQLHQLNQEFLGIDAPTDVLSFPAEHIDPDTDLPYLGDVVISVPRAHAQAMAEGHVVGDEVMLLAVHGVLHLLGYDHVEEQDKTRMWAAQAAILSSRRGGSI